MDKEVRFGQLLEQVKQTAREQGGYISNEDLNKAFSELELDENRMKMVTDYLNSVHITVSDEPPEEPEYTPEDVNFLQMYLDEIEALPTYNDGEKKAYTIQAMAGEKDAQARLTEIYLKDVVGLAKIYTGQGVLVEDLIGEGNVALSVAVTMLDSQEKPEDCEGMIIKYVMDAMEELIKENNDSSEIADKALAKVNDIFTKAEALSKEYGRKITVEELCEEEHLARKSVLDAIRISGFSIDCIETPDELKGIGG